MTCKLQFCNVLPLFSLQVVAKHAVQVAVTKGLNAESGGICLPVHCVYYLLQGRAFSKHKVPVKVSQNLGFDATKFINWIFALFHGTGLDLSPVMRVHNTTQQHCHVTHQGLRELNPYCQIQEWPLQRSHRRTWNSSGHQPSVKRTRHTSSPPLVLCAPLWGCETEPHEADRLVHLHSVFYSLWSRHWNYFVMYDSAVASGRKVHSYSAQFMSQLPMKSLLQHVQKDQGLYGSLLPALLKYVSSFVPLEHLSNAPFSTTPINSLPGCWSIIIPTYAWWKTGWMNWRLRCYHHLRWSLLLIFHAQQRISKKVNIMILDFAELCSHSLQNLHQLYWILFLCLQLSQISLNPPPCSWFSCKNYQQNLPVISPLLSTLSHPICTSCSAQKPLGDWGTLPRVFGWNVTPSLRQSESFLLLMYQNLTGFSVLDECSLGTDNCKMFLFVFYWRVRVKTVNSLSGSSHFSNCTEDSLTLDPLTVLRCDPRVFRLDFGFRIHSISGLWILWFPFPCRCPPLMEITMRILEGFLQASKAYLSTQLQASFFQWVLNWWL